MQTRDVIIELLSQFSSSREAREYLRKFSSKDAYQFAVIKVGGGVVENAVDEFASAIGFLRLVGLLPIILHGAGPQLDQALADAGIEIHKIDGYRVTTPEVMRVARRVIYAQTQRIAESLERIDVPTRTLQHGVFECDYLDKSLYGLVGSVTKVHLNSVKSATHSGTIPIVTCLGETPDGQVLNINADTAAHALALEDQPYKIIFLTETGGILDREGNVISSINLATDYDSLIESGVVHSGMLLKIKQINELLHKLPDTTSVSITSAANLTRELFTHRGAGTLVRLGEKFDCLTGLDQSLKDKIRSTVELSFNRSLRADYFDQIKIAKVLMSSSQRAAAIIANGVDQIPYLDKFVVTPEAQGEGLGATLWEQIRRTCGQLYWRSRIENPIAKWYLLQSDFCLRRGKWFVFGFGIENQDDVLRCVEDASRRPEDLI